MTEGQHKRPLWRTWLPLLTAVTLLGAFALLDGWLKRSPGAGVAPPAAWHVWTADAPATWEAFLDTKAGSGAAKELAGPLADAALAARLAAGMRPTPGRWGRWCGKQLLAWGGGTDWALSIRPGLLLRVTDALAGESVEGVRRYRGFYYAWRGGYLLASPSVAYLKASLDRASSFPAPSGQETPSLGFQWGARENLDTPLGRFVAEPTQGWPLREGEISVACTKRSGPLPGIDSWPQAPMGTFHASRWEDLEALGPYLRESAGGNPLPPWLSALWAEVVDAWQLEAPWREWVDSGTAFGLAVLDTDMSTGWPMPVFALRLDESGPAPFTAFPPPGGRIPYEWNGTPGWMFPLLGTKETLCFLQQDTRVLVSSREALMPRLLAAKTSESAADADIVFELDWQRAAEVAEQLLYRAARAELLPRRGPRDIERDLLPAVRAFRALGTLHVEGHASSDGIALTGMLARAPEDGT